MTPFERYFYELSRLERLHQIDTYYFQGIDCCFLKNYDIFRSFIIGRLNEKCKSKNEFF